ncbi:MAG: DUF2892 domain-containing protein [Bacteroidia bacterium]|nr:DUF2892 domain-containing protein [Bacteroidia bacterium]MDW8088724.1 DUF2892 domain-containing protein [Bacteroidia bacterium]
MKLAQNVGSTDRIIRLIVGGALIGAGAYLSSWVLGGVGLVLLLSAAVGRCGLYYFLGINTCAPKKS